MEDKTRAFAEFLEKEGVSCQSENLSPYSIDASFLTLGLPGLAVFPKTEAEVVKIVDYAAKDRIALTPRAKGSGTAGAAIAPEGGVLVLTDKLGVADKFGKRLGKPELRFFKADGTEVPAEKLPENKDAEVYARAGAGLSTDELDKSLAKLGWQCAVVPSSGWSAIAGNFATNAGGNGTPKYGTFQNVVSRLRMVGTGPQGAQLHVVTDKKTLVGLGGGQGLYGIITELDVRVTPKLSKDELFSCVCLCLIDDVEALGEAVGAFMCEMQEATQPLIAEFMMADKSLFKKDDPLLKNEEVMGFMTYPEGHYKFIMMYQGRKSEMTALKGIAAKHSKIEYQEISAETFKIMLDLRKASTGKSPGRVAIPGFEDIYVNDPKYLGKVLKAIYSITEGSLPGRPVGHQYTGGLVIHYRPLAAATKSEYGTAWDLTQKLCAEICTEKYKTVKRREHGLGLELFKLSTPEERKRMLALKQVYDPAGVFQPHLLYEKPEIRFAGKDFGAFPD